EGCGAADEDTLPAQFGRIVAQRQPVEAINLGVAAANFPEYADLMRDAVPLLKPQGVFLVVCANDFPAPAFTEHTDETPPVFEPISPWLPRAIQVIDRLTAGDAVPQRFHSGPFPFFEAVPSPNNPLTREVPTVNLDPALRQAMMQGKANPWNRGVGAEYEA